MKTRIKKSTFFLAVLIGGVTIFIASANAQVPCPTPTPNVILSKSNVYVTESITVSAPAGYSAGYFFSAAARVTISGNTITTNEGGTDDISGGGWVHTSGATGCSLLGIRLNIGDFNGPNSDGINAVVSNPMTDTQTADTFGAVSYFDITINNNNLGSAPPSITLTATKTSVDGSNAIFDWVGDGISSNQTTGVPTLTKTLQVSTLAGWTGTVIFRVVASYNGHTHTLSNIQMTVNPPSGCTYSISPTNANFSTAGGTGIVLVSTQVGCAWTAASNRTWITVTGGSSGTGNGTVSYSVGANAGGARSGPITIGGQVFTVNQGGVGGGTPDLIGENLAVSGNLTPGSLLSFSGRVRNGGTANVSGNTYTNMAIDIGNDGSWDLELGAGNYYLNGPLAVGASENMPWPNYWTATTGTHKFSICVDKTGLVAESNENNNCPEMLFTVSAASQPNLTAGNPSPTSATAGVAQTFNATITNSGTASTGAGFTNLFQTSPSSTGASGVVDYPVAGMSALASGGNTITSKSITFPSTGTMYVRVCADKTSSANLGVITESDEDDNCGAWTPVSISAAASATADINAANTSLPNPNGGTTLDWSYSNATACTITPPASIGGYPSGSGSAGTGSLATSRKYTISCDPVGPASSDSVTVNVAGAAASDLTVIKSGQGIVTSGSVPSQASQINCGTGCSSQTVSFLQDASVTLTANPATGRIFTGWTVQGGGSCPGTGACTVVMNSAKTVIVNFAVDPNYQEF